MLSRLILRGIDTLVASEAKGTRTRQEVLVKLREHLTPETKAEILARLPPGLARAFRKDLAQRPPLKAVGYWYSPEPSRFGDDQFPHPRDLIAPDWCVRERARIAAYLRSGWTYQQWRGFSSCRLRCGKEGHNLGSRDLTDGEWVWPEGLPHYVEKHHVRLPDEFVATMRRRRWRVPAGRTEPTWHTHGKPDFSSWVGWGKANAPHA
jgi:hypothetical protein